MIHRWKAIKKRTKMNSFEALLVATLERFGIMNYVVLVNCGQLMCMGTFLVFGLDRNLQKEKICSFASRQGLIIFSSIST